QHTAIRRPGRALIVEALSQDALTTAVGLHDPDKKLAAEALGESNEIAPRRPHRSGIAPVPLADAMLVTAISVHDVDLVRAIGVAFENDMAPVRRVAGPRIDRIAVGELKCAPAAQVHGEQVGVALTLKAHDDALPVRGETRREGHAREGAHDLLLPG